MLACCRSAACMPHFPSCRFTHSYILSREGCNKARYYVISIFGIREARIPSSKSSSFSSCCGNFSFSGCSSTFCSLCFFLSCSPFALLLLFPLLCLLLSLPQCYSQAQCTKHSCMLVCNETQVFMLVTTASPQVLLVKNRGRC